MEELLAQQQLHECLSTTVHCGASRYVEPGIPSLVPSEYIGANGTVYYHERAGEPHQSADEVLSPDVRPCNAKAEVNMYHKTGFTTSFGSNVAIVRNLPGAAPRHYVLTAFGNFGGRMTDPELAAVSSDPCTDLSVCYTRSVPRLARQLDCLIAGTPCPVSPPSNGGRDQSGAALTIGIALAVMVAGVGVWYSMCRRKDSSDQRQALL